MGLIFLNCRQDIEQQLGSLILATDINRQNEFLIRLKSHLDNQDLRLEDARDRHFMLQVSSKNLLPLLFSLLISQVMVFPSTH